MRVAIFSSYYWPEYAGTAPYVTAPAEYLVAQGHEVDVIAGFAHYPEWRAMQPRRPFARERRNGVTIHRSWHTIPHAQSTRSRAVYEATMLAGGIAELPRLGRPDVVIGVSPSLASGNLARIAARVHRRPYGLIIHDLFSKGAEQTGMAGGRAAGMLGRIERSMSAHAARLLVLTEGFSDFFVAAGSDRERITVAPPWTQRSLDHVDPAASRERLGWGADEFICLHAGNMGQKQGLQNLVDAAKLLGDQAGRLRIVFAGDGNDRARLEAEAAGTAIVEFTGGVDDDTYDAMLRGADLLLLNQRPSVDDMSLPSKLSAYLAAGRPVIGAVASGSAGGVALAASGAGYVVDPAVPAETAECIRRIMAMSESECDALGARGLAYSRDHLSRESVLPLYEQFVLQIAAGR